MAAVTIWNGSAQTERNVPVGTPLEDVLLCAGAAPAMPCGGNHTCGKCRVRASGALSAVSAAEQTLLGKYGNEGMRLACFATIEGDCTVWAGLADTCTLSWARMPRVKPDGEGYGLAVDIGTTTVAMRLYNLKTGAPVSEALEGNRQAPFGADVISRIGRAEEGESDALAKVIRAQLSDMSKICMTHAAIHKITRTVVTGNTTMLHLYEGLDASGIARAPFTPYTLFDSESAHPLAEAPTYLPPCIGAYVGADIVCALLASEMPAHPDKVTLLADIGTNGEIALMKDGKLYCCSTAAGPAFEGAGLHQGMRAAPGAVTGVSLEDGAVRVSVLGDCVATGICGSGILDAVSVMLKLGILDESGLIDEEYEGEGELAEQDGQPAWRLPGTEVLITQKDIRQIQLAKSAVCAGIRTLLDHTGVAADAVETFFVAGGFGHSMNAESAAHIGLFPEELLSKTEVIGNGSLAGASMLLLSSALREKAAEIQREATELPLSASETFMDFYVEGMLFGEEEA